MTHGRDGAVGGQQAAAAVSIRAGADQIVMADNARGPLIGGSPLSLRTSNRDFLRRHPHSLPPHSSHSLFCLLLSAGAGRLFFTLSDRASAHIASRPRSPSDSAFATASMPKKKGGKVQGRAKQKVKAQNAHSGGKAPWMKKFARSFDDGRSAPVSHAKQAHCRRSFQPRVK